MRDAKVTEDKVNQACEERVQEFKNLQELRKKIYEEAFCIFSTGYNQGLKAARDAPFVPLTDLRAPEFNSGGEQVHYGEDDKHLPKGPLTLPPTQPTIDPSRSPINDDLISSASHSPTASVTNSTDVAKQ